MADIAAGDVTYTLQSKAVGDLRNFTWKLAFGNGSLTYPAGGIPLTKASLGCPNEIRSLKIFDHSDADGKVYKYDFENNKIRIWHSAGFTPAGTNGTSTVTGTAAAQVFTGSALAAHGHDLTITKGAIGGSLELGLSADAAGASINNNTISATLALTDPVVDISAGTPAGTNASSALTATAAAQTFTGSAVAAASLVELGNVAVAATTLYVEVVGW